MAEPKLISLQSSGDVYVNLSLIRFIKQYVSAESGEITPNDNIFFFKDVKFRRDLLDIAEGKFQRVIKLDKANTIVVNPNLIFPHEGLGMIGNKISPNIPLHEAEDVMFNISKFGVEYLTTIQQWFWFSQLNHKPKVVFESEVTKYINSGIVIDESNYDSIIDLIKSDIGIVSKMIDTCDIEKSFLFILCLLYFENGFNSENRMLTMRLENVPRYLRTRNCGSGVSELSFKDMIQIPWIKTRIAAKASEFLNKELDTAVEKLAPYLGSFNIEFEWK